MTLSRIERSTSQIYRGKKYRLTDIDVYLYSRNIETKHKYILRFNLLRRLTIVGCINVLSLASLSYIETRKISTQLVFSCLFFFKSYAVKYICCFNYFFSVKIALFITLAYHAKCISFTK